MNIWFVFIRMEGMFHPDERLLRVVISCRILDIWRRVSAPVEEFFIPHDFEVCLLLMNFFLFSFMLTIANIDLLSGIDKYHYTCFTLERRERHHSQAHSI